MVGLSDHDAVGGNVFLQGNYMEIGVSASGSLGTSVAAPAGYHPQGQSGISYVVDTDGWTSGNAPRAGDFTLPRSVVKDVHEHKVILDGSKLDAKVRTAIGRAHAAEDDEDHTPAED